MENKKCFKCLQEKPISGFYRHKQMADGYLNKCIECAKKDAIENRLANIDYWRAKDRERANLPDRVAKRKEIAERWKNDPELKKRNSELKKAWQEKNAIKRAAHVLTGNAIKYGKLIKQPCEVCGVLEVDAHHDDYTKPMEVRWLCRVHHAEHHKNERERTRNS